jgi:hypothetical protein
MAISAEKLNIILAARDKEFTKAMERSQRRVEMFAKRSQVGLSKSSKSFDLLGSAAKRLAPALAAAFSVQAINNSLNVAAEIGNLSRLAGIATDDFQILAATSANFGISQEKLADILKDVNDKFGDFTEAGSGPLKDFFEYIAPQVGLTADAFADMSSDQKLGAYVAALEKANVSQSEMTFYMEAIASDSTALVAAFRNNGAAIDEMRQKADKLGFVLDEELIANAAEAKGELALMAQVISANLSQVLVELAPILVGAATAVAGFVTNIVAAIEAVQEFINPTTDLEIATDNLVQAMADEIRQSQQLDIALGRSTAVSVETAKQKLEEARARHENAKAAIAEQRAISLGSQAYTSVVEQIAAAQDAARSISAAPDTLISASKIQAYEDVETRLVELRAEQARMLAADQELTDQFARTEDNIKSLEDALTRAEGGMVTFGQSVATPIEASERLSGSVSRVKTETQGLLDNLAEASPALNRLGLDVEQVGDIMQGVESNMESAFMGIVDGTASAKDAFKSMAADIIKELYRVLVVQQLVGSFKTGGGGILGAIAPVFGRASGGAVQAGEPYVTGEHGRELFVPSQNGRILSAAQTNNMERGGGDGGVTVIQNNTFGNGVNRAEINAMLPKIVEASKAAVMDAKRQGGSYGKAFG